MRPTPGGQVDQFVQEQCGHLWRIVHLRRDCDLGRAVAGMLRRQRFRQPPAHRAWCGCAAGDGHAPCSCDNPISRGRGHSVYRISYAIWPESITVPGRSYSVTRSLCRRGGELDLRGPRALSGRGRPRSTLAHVVRPTAREPDALRQGAQDACEMRAQQGQAGGEPFLAVIGLQHRFSDHDVDPAPARQVRDQASQRAGRTGALRRLTFAGRLTSGGAGMSAANGARRTNDYGSRSITRKTRPEILRISIIADAAGQSRSASRRAAAQRIASGRPAGHVHARARIGNPGHDTAVSRTGGILAPAGSWQVRDPGHDTAASRAGGILAPALAVSVERPGTAALHAGAQIPSVGRAEGRRGSSCAALESRAAGDGRAPRSPTWCVQLRATRIRRPTPHSHATVATSSVRSSAAGRPAVKRPSASSTEAMTSDAERQPPSTWSRRSTSNCSPAGFWASVMPSV